VSAFDTLLGAKRDERITPNLYLKNRTKTAKFAILGSLWMFAHCAPLIRFLTIENLSQVKKMQNFTSRASRAIVQPF
jgi:hypothetical protein